MRPGPPLRMGGGIAGAGTLPVPGGGGVAPPGPPIFWRRDLRSILGLSVVRHRGLARPYVPRRGNVNAAATVAPHARRGPTRGHAGVERHSKTRRANRILRGRRMLAPAVASRPAAPTPAGLLTTSPSPSHLAMGAHAAATFGPREATGTAPRVLVVDNYDSFTFNLVQYLGELGAAGRGHQERRDRRRGRRRPEPHGVLISPGPCTPNEAGISLDVLRALGEHGAHLRRVPRASGHRAGLRRTRRPGRAAHARQDLPHPPRRPRGLRRARHRPSRRRATTPSSSSARRSRNASRSARGRRKARSWGSGTGSTRVEGVQFHPESVLTHEGKRSSATGSRRSPRARGFPCRRIARRSEQEAGRERRLRQDARRHARAPAARCRGRARRVRGDPRRARGRRCRSARSPSRSACAARRPRRS